MQKKKKKKLNVFKMTMSRKIIVLFNKTYDINHDVDKKKKS